ncbi:MAG: hypothetical protein M3142_06475 [Bacteroidota bacterium]|nr:hypothetical protein [Bacteroidota bacterium]
MVTVSSNTALLALIEQACALNNYDQLKTYGIIVRPDVLRPGKVFIKHNGNEFDCQNDPETIKDCLQDICGLR